MLGRRWRGQIVGLLIAVAIVAAVALRTSLAAGAHGRSAADHRCSPAAGCVLAAEIAAATTESAARDVDAFGLDLLRRLPTTGNVVFSPYDIDVALAMVDVGAGGSTEKAIDHVLHVPDRVVLLSGLVALRRAIAVDARAEAGAAAASKAPALDLAAGLWLQQGLAVRSAFTSALTRYFGATVQRQDFEGRPEAARSAINSWVAAHTGGIIGQLMPPGSITPATSLMLADAIYLKALWAHTFDASMTTTRTFVAEDGDVQVPFMEQDGTSLPFASSDAYQAVELPYRHSHLSMLVIMPTAGTVTRYADTLTAGGLARVVSSLRSTPLRLWMPRFHLTFDTELKGPLAALGMGVAFSQQADFSAITGKPALTISTVQHDADLKVDEQGTVAAAATGIGLVPTAAPAPQELVKMIVDHPFLVFLRDDETGAVLFAARVSDPLAS